MKKITVIFLILMFAGTIGCKKNDEEATNDDAFSGTISISGAWALYPMAIKWAEEFQKLHPTVKVDVSAGGAGKGIADALAGAVDIGMVSRDINPTEVEKGACGFAVTRDAVVATVNRNNPVLAELLSKGVTREAFIDIWITGKIKTWGEVVAGAVSQPISVYTRSDACGAAETWAKYLGKKQEDLLGVGVYGDPGVAEAVAKDDLGVGFNNINYAYDPQTKKVIQNLCIIPIDINGNGKIDADENFYANRDEIILAISQGRYPSPPARTLFLATRGVPQRKTVQQFIRWILTDGQQYVAETGYIHLPPETIRQGLTTLSQKTGDK